MYFLTLVTAKYLSINVTNNEKQLRCFPNIGKQRSRYLEHLSGLIRGSGRSRVLFLLGIAKQALP